nr:hypothetical protein CFP56_52890 [Quercus suber]
MTSHGEHPFMTGIAKRWSWYRVNHLRLSDYRQHPLLLSTSHVSRCNLVELLYPQPSLLAVSLLHLNFRRVLENHLKDTVKRTLHRDVPNDNPDPGSLFAYWGGMVSCATWINIRRGVRLAIAASFAGRMPLSGRTRNVVQNAKRNPSDGSAAANAQPTRQSRLVFSGRALFLSFPHSRPASIVCVLPSQYPQLFALASTPFLPTAQTLALSPAAQEQSPPLVSSSIPADRTLAHCLTKKISRSRRRGHVDFRTFPTSRRSPHQQARELNSNLILTLPSIYLEAPASAVQRPPASHVKFAHEAPRARAFTCLQISDSSGVALGMKPDTTPVLDM